MRHLSYVTVVCFRGVSAHGLEAAPTRRVLPIPRGQIKIIIPLLCGYSPCTKFPECSPGWVFPVGHSRHIPSSKPRSQLTADRLLKLSTNRSMYRRFQPAFVGPPVQISGQYLIHFFRTKALDSDTIGHWDFNY